MPLERWQLDSTLRNCKHEGYIPNQLVNSWLLQWHRPELQDLWYPPLGLYSTDVWVSLLFIFCCISHTCPHRFIYFLVVETNYVTPPPSKAWNVAHTYIMITSQTTSGKKKYDWWWTDGVYISHREQTSLTSTNSLRKNLEYFKYSL